MHSAKFAAETITAALAANDVSATALLRYEQKLRGGAEMWQRFVRLFYEVSPIFGRVVADSEARPKVLRLCEGEVYNGTASETLSELRQEFDAIRANPEHPLQKHLAAVS